MDTFLCSSWYQYAYLSPYYKKGESLAGQNSPWDPAIGQYWLPVDQYTGGIEHATMHLLYTRFFTLALRDIGVVDFSEPMRRLFNQGMILGPDGEKMSKSRGNVINPDNVVSEYGIDTVRGYMMFIGPWDQGGPWDPSAIDGIRRFLQRTWNLIVDYTDREQPLDAPPMPHPDQVNLLEQTVHQTIIKITEGMGAFRFNTVIAHLMELSNALLKMKSTSVVYATQWGGALRDFILLMAPLFPHISEELWHRLGNVESVHLQKWPQADVNKAKMDRSTVVVQVNSRVRSQMTVPLGMSDSALEQQAVELPAIKKWLENKRIRKVIVVPDRLVNIVTD
jgi:leucyl-tRNA synthetase